MRGERESAEGLCVCLHSDRGLILRGIAPSTLHDILCLLLAYSYRYSMVRGYDSAVPYSSHFYVFDASGVSVK